MLVKKPYERNEQNFIPRPLVVHLINRIRFAATFKWRAAGDRKRGGEKRNKGTKTDRNNEARYFQTGFRGRASISRVRAKKGGKKLVVNPIQLWHRLVLVIEILFFPSTLSVTCRGDVRQKSRASAACNERGTLSIFFFFIFPPFSSASRCAIPTPPVFTLVDVKDARKKPWSVDRHASQREIVC